jgi:hypothetical protein
VIASVRSLWENHRNEVLCAHYVPVVCPNQPEEASEEIEPKQNPAFDDEMTSAFSGGVRDVATDAFSML